MQASPLSSPIKKPTKPTLSSRTNRLSPSLHASPNLPRVPIQQPPTQNQPPFPSPIKNEKKKQKTRKTKEKMINIVAFSLLISTLAAAGISTSVDPPPPPPRREGHRLIVIETIEYEREIHPNEPPPTLTLQQAKEKLLEASSVLPNLGQGLSTPEQTGPGKPEKPTAHSAKELICDAVGDCKEKISAAFHKSKEKLAGKASEFEETARGSVEESARKAAEIKESAKNVVKDGASRAVEKASELEETARKSAAESARKAEEIEESAKKMVEESAHKVKEKMEGEVRSAKQRVVEVKEAVETGAEDVGENFSRAVERAVRWVRGWDLAGMGRLAGTVVHLVGFAVAYGTSMWVTFASSHVLRAGLGRQQYAMMQSKMYPVYFRVVAAGIGVAAAGEWVGKGWGREVCTLVFAMGLVLANMWGLGPKAAKVNSLIS